MIRGWVLLLALTLAPGAVALPRLAALLNDPEIAEISGIAASRAHPGMLWVHNDSFSGAMLYALSNHGKRLGRLTIDGVQNFDWEDMAAFDLDGRHYLLIADTGDNGGIRRELQLHVIEEPSALGDAHARPAWSIAFRWPDGARDVEAVAVDAAHGMVLLIGKKRVPPDLFALPLRPSRGDTLVARRIGALAGIAQPNAEDIERNPVYGRYRSQITAADISPDGRMLAVLNYRTIYVYTRIGDADWASAVVRPGRELPFPWLAQTEALAFDLDGRQLWLTSERRPTPLLRVPLPTR